MPFGVPPEANFLKSGFIAFPLAGSRVSAFGRRPSAVLSPVLFYRRLASSNMAFTSSAPPVRTFPAKPGIFTALDRMMFLIVEADKAGIYAFSKAAAPATCGADIEVPFLGVYPPCRSRLRIPVPGAAISTLSNP